MSARWHYNQDGAQYGPVDEAEIVRLIQDGELAPGSPVLKKGSMDWQPARNHACFQVEIYPKQNQSTKDNKERPDLSIDPDFEAELLRVAGTTQSSSVTTCDDCSKGISVHTQSCPHCGSPAKYALRSWRAKTSSQPAEVKSTQSSRQADPPQTAEAATGRGKVMSFVALLIAGLVLWGAYSFFFGSLSPEGLGEEVFHALVDNDVDKYISDCTPWEYSHKNIMKLVMKYWKVMLDDRVENGGITEEERDRELMRKRANFEEKFSASEMEDDGKKARESFKETIDKGKGAGLNWSKAEFEFVDDSDFQTSESEGEDAENIPKGYGEGDLSIVVSEGGKRYKIEIDDCIMVPGYGCLNGDGLRWIGEIK